MTDAAVAFVSLGQFSKRTSLSRGTIYNLIDRGELPQPVRLTENRVAFPASVVDEWCKAKVGGAA